MSDITDRLRGIADSLEGDQWEHPLTAQQDCLRAAEEIERLRKELDQSRDSANANAHVIVEAGVIPGIDYSCRCEECRSVARAMDGAGYLERVKDRWWRDDCVTAEARREE